MIPGHMEKKNREILGYDRRNTPPSFHGPQRYGTITHQKEDS